MAIEPRFSMEDVHSYIEAEKERLHRGMIRTLSYLGERCVAHARDRSSDLSWIDHTGNLRSSIGYIVAYDGTIVLNGGFSGNGDSGGYVGKQFTDELARTIRRRYALIVVAGMHYASYVEAVPSKDVLSSAELLAEREAPRLIKRLMSSL